MTPANILTEHTLHPEKSNILQIPAIYSYKALCQSVCPLLFIPEQQTICLSYSLQTFFIHSSGSGTTIFEHSSGVDKHLYHIGWWQTFLYVSWQYFRLNQGVGQNFLTVGAKQFVGALWVLKFWYIIYSKHMPYILQTKKCPTSSKMFLTLSQTPALHPQNTNYKSPELQSCVLY